MFAEVAVDTYQDPSKKTFTYSVPEEMERKIRPGMKVLAPFGKRTVEGYVLELKRTRPSFPTREIREIRSPAFTPLQVQLARWMANYYASPPLDCLKCQLLGRGQRYTEGETNDIKTLLLVPYASHVKIKALGLSQAQRKTTLIGSRSTVFAPLPNLKRIIIEEPENWAYKDERSPYYHAKDVAQKRAELEGLKLELKYLIPRVEDFPLSRQAHRLLNPSGLRVQIVDLQKERAAGNFSPLSRNLATLIRRQRPVLAFLNSNEAKARVQRAIKEQNLDVNTIEIAGAEIFGQIGKRYAAAVMVDADTLFNLPDFRAHEKLVTAVAKLGQLTKETVYIQTANATHPLFEELKTGNLEPFYQRELESRKPFLYPPFGVLAKLEFSAKTTAKVEEEAQRLYKKLLTASCQLSTTFVSPPYSPYSKTRGKAQLNIAIKAKMHQNLTQIFSLVPPTWRLIVNPESLL